MLNNYEIQSYLSKKTKFKDFEVAQVDSKIAPEASHLIYKRGNNSFTFIKIQETMTSSGDKDRKKLDPIQEIEPLKTLSFSSFSKIKFEKFALAKQYTFEAPNSEDNFVLRTWMSTTEMLAVIPKKVTVEIIERPFYSKIVGFRSGSPLNMIIALIIYVAIIALLVKLIFF